MVNNILSNIKELTPENEHLIKWMLGTMGGGGYDTVSFTSSSTKAAINVWIS
jgi:hypothetical protein